MNRPQHTIRTGFLTAFGLCIALTTFGCHHPCGRAVGDGAAMHAAAPVLTTASADAARRTTTSSVAVVRPFDQCSISAKGGAVMHQPLYFRGPYERSAPDGATPVPTGADFASSLAASGHFIFSSVFYPVHALAFKPWNTVASAGRHQHGIAADDDVAPERSTDSAD